jgi:hypothetical protein
MVDRAMVRVRLFSHGSSSSDQLKDLSDAYIKMNSVHNEIVIWSSLMDPDVSERGRGIHWICLWNNHSRVGLSQGLPLSPQDPTPVDSSNGSDFIDRIVIDRIQSEVFEWKQHRLNTQRLSRHPTRRLLESPPQSATHLPLLLCAGVLLLIFFLLSRGLLFHKRAGRRSPPS